MLVLCWATVYDVSPASNQHWDNVSCLLSPSGWSWFQPQIVAVQNRGTFLWTVISKTCPQIIRSKIVFFRSSNISVPCPHAQLTGRTVIKKLWTFFGPWGWDHSQSPTCWIFQVKPIHQSTASVRTTRLLFAEIRYDWVNHIVPCSQCQLWH